MSGQNGTGPSEAAAFLAAGRKLIQLSTGRSVLVRRVPRAALAYFIETIPDLTSVDETVRRPREIRSPQDLQRSEDVICKVIVSASVEPKFSDGKDGGLTPADLDYAEQLDLFNAILAFSGFSAAAAEEVRPLSETGA